MAVLATKITKTNKVVTLFESIPTTPISDVDVRTIAKLFLEKIGCDCILYDQYIYYYDTHVEAYAIFAEVKETDKRREGGGLWFCRKKSDGDFEYKMISNDACYAKFCEMNFATKGLKTLWDETEDVSTGKERIRFRDI